MTRTAFVELTQRLEAEAVKDPKAFRRGTWLRLWGWLLGSQLVVWAPLALLLAGMAAFPAFFLTSERRNPPVALFAGLVALVFYVWVLASWVQRFLFRRQPPAVVGVPMQPALHPGFYKTVQEAAATLGPGFQAEGLDCWVASAPTAYVVRLPGEGWFARPRRRLVIGLPLLLALDEEEARTVFAHELRHMAARHDRYRAFSELAFGLAQYVLQTTVPNASSVKRHGWRWLVDWLETGYARMNVEQRMDERDADAYSARVFGPDTTARALSKWVVYSIWMDRDLWPLYWAKAADLHEPNVGPASLLRDGLERGFPPGMLERCFREATAAVAYSNDSHPALTERLRHLGTAPVMPRPARPSAAEVLFGEQLGAVAQEADSAWRYAIIPDWNGARGAHLHGRSLVKELQPRLAGEVAPPLTQREARNLARAAESSLDGAEALPIVRACAELFPQHPELGLRAGVLTARFGHEDPARFFQRVLQGPADYVSLAYAFWHRWLLEQGSPRAPEIYQEWCAATDRVWAAADDRQQLPRDESDLRFERLTPDDANRLNALLGRIPPVRQAYLAQRPSKLLPNDRYWLLFLVLQKGVAPAEAAQVVHYVVHELDLELPVHVLVKSKGTGPLLKLLTQRAAQTLVYTAR